MDTQDTAEKTQPWHPTEYVVGHHHCSVHGPALGTQKHPSMYDWPMMEREAAWQLLTEHVADTGLRRHMLAVEAAMRWYAVRLGHDPQLWGIVGLIHDFDWEVHPTLPDHPLKGADILRGRGVDEQIVRPILSHYEQGTNVPRQQPIDFALLACDEITGLLIACTLVRPGRDIGQLTIKSIKKKWKEKSFAAGVDRQQVEDATSDFARECFDGSLDLWDHAANVLTAMQGVGAALELDGRPAG